MTMFQALWDMATLVIGIAGVAFIAHAQAYAPIDVSATFEHITTIMGSLTP